MKKCGNIRKGAYIHCPRTIFSPTFLKYPTLGGFFYLVYYYYDNSELTSASFSFRMYRFLFIIFVLNLNS